jgi:hypothetical protein
MSWGVEPVRRDQQGKSTIRMEGVYAAHPQIASTFALSAADWQSLEFAGVDAVSGHAPSSERVPAGRTMLVRDVPHCRTPHHDVLRTLIPGSARLRAFRSMTSLKKIRETKILRQFYSCCAV